MKRTLLGNTTLFGRGGGIDNTNNSALAASAELAQYMFLGTATYNGGSDPFARGPP